MRWTRQRRARGRDRRAGSPVSDQGAQTHGEAAYGKTVWSWHPLLVSSLRKGEVAQPGRPFAVNSLTTVTRRIRRRGEHGISRKAIAQGMSDASAEPVCSCAQFFAHLAHETAGAARTRHSLLPLIRGTNEPQTSGASRRGIVKSCLERRHCEERSDEAIQFFSSAAQWIASLRSQ